MNRNSIHDMCVAAQKAATILATTAGSQRSEALHLMPDMLKASRDRLRKANTADIEDARTGGMAEPLLKRLEISDKVFAYMEARLLEAAALPDPVGKVLEGQTRPDGLRVAKITVPIGVIGIIYESRPNVTTDAAAVCLKSGNAVILRGGSEALRTNDVLVNAMIQASLQAGLPESSVQMIRVPGHEAVGELLAMHEYVDALIPRGGKPLIQRISEGTRIPVIKHYDGICHVYLAEDAPLDMAIDITINSKCQRVEVCNALETLLVDVACAERILPVLVQRLREQGVECRGCPLALKTVPDILPASDEDWVTEYLAPILAIKVVNGLDDAIQHINTYGSGHTDVIVTRRTDWADRFISAVDSASVLVNASTRLSGGGAYGMGAVVGISTDKLHARGPVGPSELTSTKWVVFGNGHLRK